MSFIVDPNDSGLAASLHISQTYYGRLVRVVAFDAGGARQVMHENFVMSPTDLGNGVDYIVETNQITGEQTLVVFRNIDNPTSLASFRQFVLQLGSQLRVVADNGFVGIGSYTMVPRNAAYVVQFDDLLDPRSLNDESFKVLVGVPTIVPFEARVFLDPNYGDLADHNGDGVAEFYPTRIVVDPTVSEPESFATSPPLPVNTTGFPPSVNTLLSNVQIRIPTVLAGLSTDTLLQNPTQHRVASTGNGSVDFGTPSRDVVRAFRSGGNQASTSDPFNGYLRDEDAPRLVGSLDLQINMPPVQSPTEPLEFTLPQVTFLSSFCAQAPQRGDLISQPGLFAELLDDAAVQPNGVAMDLSVRLIVFPASWNGDPGQFVTSGANPAQYLVPFDPIDDAARAACFVEVSPPPTGAPNNPAVGLLPNSIFTVRFNEPIDPASLVAFDTLLLSRREVPQEAIDYVPGTLQRSVDLQQFTFTPSLPLAHMQGNAETYYVRLAAAPMAASDLAGNPLFATLPPVALGIEPTAVSQATGGRVIRFTGPDEEAPRDGDPGDPTPPPGGLIESIPEWNGQHVYDVARELIRPRPVTRTQLVGDRNQLLPGNMAQQLTGQNLPLNNFGAKTQLMWRYIDFGIQLKTDDRVDARLDPTFLNIDVEGMSMAPLGGGIVFESYPRFRMRMAHGQFAPDEALDAFGNIAFPNSGMTGVFENNYLSISEEPPVTVHEDFRGFQLNPADVFQTGAGTNLLPMPFNRGLPPSQKRFFTWRNTILRTRGGTNGTTEYPIRWYQLTGNPTPIRPGPDNQMPPMPSCDPMFALPNFFFTAGTMRSAALPLLVQFDTFPTSGAQTLNVFDTSALHAVQTTPFMRAFSAGGFDPQGNIVTIDPDLEVVANGGFNPLGTPPGTSTPGTDNTYYIAGLDLVVRVSRSASIYYPAIDPLTSDGNPLTYDDLRFQAPTYLPALLDPRPEDQPQGTSVVVRYRGADLVPNLHRGRVDATQMDPYGDFYPDRENAEANFCDRSVNHEPAEENIEIAFFNGSTWKNDITQLNGAQFIQLHLTFLNNVETGLSPSVSSIALSWRQ